MTKTRTAILLFALVAVIAGVLPGPAAGAKTAGPDRVVAEMLANRPAGVTEAQWEKQFQSYTHHVAVLRWASYIKYLRTLEYAAAVEAAKQQAIVEGNETTAWPWGPLAQCESSGNWSSNVGSFDGGLQFLPSTWLAQGGGEFAPYAWQATPHEQIIVAKRLLAASGWGQWPQCSRVIGAR